MEWWLLVSRNDKDDPMAPGRLHALWANAVLNDMIAQKLDNVVHKVYLTDYSLSN